MTVATLHEPAQDSPATMDPTTAILLGLKQKLRWRLLFYCALATVGFGPWLAVAASLWETPYPLASAVVICWIGTAGAAWLWMLWVPRAAALMWTRPWRPVTARVVRAGRPTFTSVVECDGDTLLRVSNLTAAHHALIARTARVWVVGPDDKGWASVRVDGSHVVFPARQVSASRRTSAVEAGDVTALTAARMRVRSSFFLRCSLAVVLWLIAMGVSGAPWLSMVGITAVPVYLLVRQGQAAFIDRRLPMLVADADWRELPVSMNPWFWREDGTSTAEGIVRLPDGRTLAARMPNATVDLLGTIYERGTVWFSAVPESGKTVAVGFPGYPLLAVATIQ